MFHYRLGRIACPSIEKPIHAGRDVFALRLSHNSGDGRAVSIQYDGRGYNLAVISAGKRKI